MLQAKYTLKRKQNLIAKSCKDDGLKQHEEKRLCVHHTEGQPENMVSNSQKPTQRLLLRVIVLNVLLLTQVAVFIPDIEDTPILANIHTANRMIVSNDSHASASLFHKPWVWAKTVKDVMKE